MAKRKRGIAQVEELTAHEPSAAENNPPSRLAMTNEDNTAEAQVRNWILATGTKPGARHERGLFEAREGYSGISCCL